LNVDDLIARTFGTIWSADPKTGEYKVTCPYCNVKALWLNVNLKVFHCFSCQAGGRAESLVPGLSAYWTPTKSQSLATIATNSTYAEQHEDNALPKGYVDVVERAEFPEGWDYITSRGVDPSKVRWGKYNEFSVCFPFFEDGVQVYWQARRIYGQFKRKTVNPQSQIGKSHFVYNIDSMVQGGPVLVVEGIFDALRTHGVSTCGKTISDTQIRKIIAKRPSVVFVCYDGDAYDASVVASRAFRELSALHAVVPVRIPEDVDPADLGGETYRYVSEAYSKFRSAVLASRVSEQEIVRWLDARLSDV